MIHAHHGAGAALLCGIERSWEREGGEGGGVAVEGRAFGHTDGWGSHTLAITCTGMMASQTYARLKRLTYSNFVDHLIGPNASGGQAEECTFVGTESM